MKKKYPSAEAKNKALWFYVSVRSDHTPQLDGAGTDTELSYRWVDGRQAVPSDWTLVRKTAARELWNGQSADFHRRTYWDYVCRLATKLNVSVPPFVQWAVCDGPLTAVRVCHGDLTLANVVINSRGAPVFIDPGDPRGLPCAELDEAKLLQSALGFEAHLLHGCNQQEHRLEMLTALWNPVTRGLLWTHLLRMLPHAGKHSNPTAWHNWACTMMRQVEHPDWSAVIDTAASMPAIAEPTPAESVPVRRPDTWLVDLDGVLLHHDGSPPCTQWSDYRLVPGAAEWLSELERRGDCIVLVSARKECCRAELETRLRALGFVWDQLVLGLTSGHRWLVNDGGPEQRTHAVQVPRNPDFTEVRKMVTL